jgi:hypothetical protein
MVKYLKKDALVVLCAVLLTGLSAYCAFQCPARERGIDNALLQPIDMPLSWGFEWLVRGEGACVGRWSVFTQGDLQPSINHIIFDCPDVSTAKALVYSRSAPELRAKRSPIMGDAPAHADEFLAYCDIPDWKRQLSPTQIVSEKYCTTLARYGRVVSVMEVNAILPSTMWPLEGHLLKWTVERNDRRLVALPE